MLWAAVLLAGVGSACAVFFLAVRQNNALLSEAESGDVGKAEEVLDRRPDLLDHRSKSHLTPLLVASWHGRTEVLRLLISRGADVNAKWDSPASGDGRWNALHITAIEGHAAAAQVLIAAGTEVNAKSLRGETPLDVAVRYGRPELAEVLRAHGGVSGKQVSPR
jgi:ankyrin repeat protein